MGWVSWLRRRFALGRWRGRKVDPTMFLASQTFLAEHCEISEVTKGNEVERKTRLFPLPPSTPLQMVSSNLSFLSIEPRSCSPDHHHNRSSVYLPS